MHKRLWACLASYRHPLGRQPSETAIEAGSTHLTGNSVEYELFAFRQFLLNKFNYVRGWWGGAVQ